MSTTEIAAESPAEVEGTQESTEGVESAQIDAKSVPETFSAEYVHELREESKANRLKAARADYLATEVRRLATREAARLAGLTDPEALPWDEAWELKDGIDHQAIQRAAEELVRERPHLGRPRGSVGQGEHGETKTGPSLSDLLRGSW